MTNEDGSRFKKGDMVRCINADDGCGFLVKGNVYEVWSVRPYEGLTISRTSPMWEESQFEPASQLPAWVERLAREWEATAAQWRSNHEHYDGEEECEDACNAEAKQVERCAAELRERAKGGRVSDELPDNVVSLPR